MTEEEDMAMYMAFIGLGVCITILAGILTFLDTINNLKREFKKL